MERHLLASTLRHATPFFVIAGPCVIESKTICLQIAYQLAQIADNLKIPIVFKASFDKANRQDINSFRGPGIDNGLAILQHIKQATKLPILTDCHEPWQVPLVAEVADVIQIPAFLSRQTDLVVAAAKSRRLVNIKKGQMLSAETMLLAAEKVAATQGDNEFLVTERGTMFGYGDLIVDPRNLVKLRRSGGMVVQDITHSVQRTSSSQGTSTTSGGDREFIPTIARMAAAVGVDGLFLETHPDPERALCDASTMFPLSQVEPLLSEVLEIANVSDGLGRRHRVDDGVDNDSSRAIGGRGSGLV